MPASAAKNKSAAEEAVKVITPQKGDFVLTQDGGAMLCISGKYFSHDPTTAHTVWEGHVAGVQPSEMALVLKARADKQAAVKAAEDRARQQEEEKQKEQRERDRIVREEKAFAEEESRRKQYVARTTAARARAAAGAGTPMMLAASREARKDAEMAEMRAELQRMQSLLQAVPAAGANDPAGSSGAGSEEKSSAPSSECTDNGEDVDGAEEGSATEAE